MPKHEHAWASWNCIGQWNDMIASMNPTTSTTTTTTTTVIPKKKEEEENNNDNDKKKQQQEEQEENELLLYNYPKRAVFVTYRLNQLQNLIPIIPSSSNNNNDDNNNNKNKKKKKQQKKNNIFVSLNPYPQPANHLTYKSLQWGHPQFTIPTLLARQELLFLQQQEQYNNKNNNNGKNNKNGHCGLWFAGAWTGYGFHEDGCRSGFQVATQLSGIPVPWIDSSSSTTTTTTTSSTTTTTKSMVLDPPDFVTTTIAANKSQQQRQHTASSLFFGWMRTIYEKVTYDWPIAIGQSIVLSYLKRNIQYGQLQLHLPNGTIHSFGNDNNNNEIQQQCDDPRNSEMTMTTTTPTTATTTNTTKKNQMVDTLLFGGNTTTTPITVRIFDNWFFVKIACQGEMGFAQSYMNGYFLVLEEQSQQSENLLLSSSNDLTTSTITKKKKIQTETSVVLGDVVGLTRLSLLCMINSIFTSSPIGNHGSRRRRRHQATTSSSSLSSSSSSSWGHGIFQMAMAIGQTSCALLFNRNKIQDLCHVFVDTETCMLSGGAIFDTTTTTTSYSGGGDSSSNTATRNTQQSPPPATIGK